MIKRIPLIWLLLFGAFAGMAQALTSTFTFTASGYLGTPATATTPFQGQTFPNATITITSIGNTANRIYSAFVLPNQFPLTVGKRGIAKFQTTGGLAGLGLRFSRFGTFTSVPTM